ncbi:hypothetical protein F5J12DRAFT_785719 [Pisolithus orientalis]|uniref:uncharacterized protein n=1 Tax=Pisolithus orientalis TaxID=936130 RepID=UPI0022259AC1|nr:uncharacterized protein F5J12DRAFT_785719 [Pisolithus orientalis]KAI5994921.1 hypothetical protein F5J12DRAFT_785719 [Pisolithus orientalis]
MPPKCNLPDMKEPPAKCTHSGASTVVPKTIIIPAANLHQQTHAPVSPDVIMLASLTADTLKGNAELSSPAMTVLSLAEDGSDESVHTLSSIENADSVHLSAMNINTGLHLTEKPDILHMVQQLPNKIPLKEAPSTASAMTIGAIVPTEIGCFIDDDHISGCSEALQKSHLPCLVPKEWCPQQPMLCLSVATLQCSQKHYVKKDLGGHWSIFQAQFKLQAVYLLQDGPETDKEQIENKTEIADLAL